jgi:branched-chain amino acid transport system permease protein
MGRTLVQLLIDGISIGIVYVLMAAGFNLIMSVEKILFLPFAQFYMLGAYFTWYMMVPLKLNFAVAVVVATVGTGILGAIAYVLTFRWVQYKEGQFLTNLLIGVGWMLIITQVALNLFGTEARGIPTVFKGTLRFAGLNISVEKTVAIGVGIAVLVALQLMLQKTRLGRAMRAVSFNSDVAALQGVNSGRVFTFTMGFGCALAGLAGALLAPVFAVTTQVGGFAFLVPLVVLLGGLGSMLGAILAGLIFGMALSYGQYFIGGGGAQMAFFVVVAIVLMLRPGGILGKAMGDIPL